MTITTHPNVFTPEDRAQFRKGELARGGTLKEIRGNTLTIERHDPCTQGSITISTSSFGEPEVRFRRNAEEPHLNDDPELIFEPIHSLGPPRIVTDRVTTRLDAGTDLGESIYTPDLEPHEALSIIIDDDYGLGSEPSRLNITIDQAGQIVPLNVPNTGSKRFSCKKVEIISDPLGRSALIIGIFSQNKTSRSDTVLCIYRDEASLVAVKIGNGRGMTLKASIIAA